MAYRWLRPVLLLLALQATSFVGSWSWKACRRIPRRAEELDGCRAASLRRSYMGFTLVFHGFTVVFKCFQRVFMSFRCFSRI